LSKLQATREWVDNNRRITAGAAVLVVAYFVLARPDVPPVAYVLAIGGVSAGAVGYAGAYALEKLFGHDKRIMYVKLGFPGFHIWRLNDEMHERVEVVGADGLFKLRTFHFDVYEVEAFFPEGSPPTAKATWRASATNMELVEHKQKVDEVRGELEDEARKGMALRVKLGRVVRDAVYNISLGILREQEGLTVRDGEKIDEAVERATEKYDIEDELNDVAGEHADDVADDPDDALDEWKAVPVESTAQTEVSTDGD